MEEIGNVDENTARFAKLVCLVLSGNTKDSGCIKATVKLHKAGYLDINKMASAKEENIKNIIWKAGYQRKRSEFLVRMAKKILSVYGGVVPGNLGALTSFDGVARKTAILTLNEAFGLFKGIGCDVHVSQCSEAMKLVKHVGKRLSPLHAEMALREWIQEKNFREVNKIFGSFAQLFTQSLPLRTTKDDSHYVLVDRLTKAAGDFLHRPYHVELLFCLIQITRHHYRNVEPKRAPGKKHHGKPVGDSDPEQSDDTELSDNDGGW